MSVLLQISDTHFGTERPPVLEALVRFARELRPDVLVLSGDITQRARRPQFRAAAEAVARLAVSRTLTIPGNHDIPLYNLPARLFAPYRGYRRAFGQELAPSLDLPDMLVICVLTTRRYRHVDGELSRAQVARVAGRLRDASPAQPRIVVTHQPLHVVRPEDEKNVLHGHEHAIRTWADAGADLALSGHIHLPYVRPLSERMPGLSREMWIANAGTAVSRRVRYEAANSVNVVRSAAGTRALTVERCDFNAQSDAFEVRESVRIAPL